jgi:uncharacterized protein YndB with AHSA1/START domain
MVTIDVTLDIDRPVADVFAYLTDPRRMPEWVSTVKEVKADGPPRLGAKLVQTHAFLGRSVSVTAEITAYEEDREVAFATRSPLPVTQTLTLRPEGSGTRLRAVMEADFGVFRPAAEGIVAARARREYERDLGRLKDLLEARPALA